MIPAWSREASPVERPWRDAAVLILIHPLGPGLGFPLLVRSDGLPHHSGQIGLPGGAREGTESFEETALREAEEEIGVPGGSVELLGSLSRLRIARSGYDVQPFVGWTPATPSYKLQESEVAGLIDAPLSFLCEPGAEGEAELSVDGGQRLVPCYRVSGRVVWGATAMMLAELADLLAACQGQDAPSAVMAAFRP
jgi:8-oxo-dGTP pyrophosphatase MutT (NUDIX family)